MAIAHLHTVRTIRSWVMDPGDVAVELADDRVHGESAGGHTSAFRQLEAEVAPGFDVEILDDLVERLKTAGAKPDSYGVKVTRALGLDAIDPPEVQVASLDRHPTAREVIQQSLARSVVRMIRELPAAQLGEDTEGVHQARVASRRLRSDLRTFGPLLDTEWAEALHEDLRPLTAHLGPVRDADVLLERLTSVVLNHPEIDRAGAEGVLTLLRQQREVARSALVEYLASAEFHELLDRLVEGTTDAPTTAKADDPAGVRLPPLIRARWRKLDKAVQRLGPCPSPAALHRVRMLTKRSRYAAEAVADVCGPAARRHARHLAQVQDELGEQNDIIVAERWLVANGEGLEPAAAFAAGRLAQLLHATSNRDAGSWMKPYREARRKRNRTWFTSPSR